MRSARDLEQQEPAAQRMTEEERAIAQSVLYASLFDYPLTLCQLRQALIGSRLTPTEILSLYAGSEALKATIGFAHGQFFPKRRSDLVAERRRREMRSRTFLKHHRRLLNTICAIPYVRMVALSGSVAHLNLDDSGDLDLFVVTRGRHVWSVTVAIVLLAKIMRRRATLCANFVVADTRLAFEDQDLFSASQIVHLKPIIGADTYAQILRMNPFVGGFYPNFHPARSRQFVRRTHPIAAALKRLCEKVFALPAWVGENICHTAYRVYLTRRASTWRSPDQVRLEPDYLKLHTQSHRQSVMKRFSRATNELQT